MIYYAFVKNINNLGFPKARKSGSKKSGVKEK
jgi:hypothetical protein